MDVFKNSALIAIATLFPRILVTIACMSKAPADKSHWDYLNIPRETNMTCECGQYDSEFWKSPSWNLYVHIKTEDHKKTCVGTIIASNLVVTSHKCLVLPSGGKRMRLYDLLKLKLTGSQSMAAVDQVTLTNTKASQPNTVILKVVNIFYNPQYALSSELRKYPDNDMVLIKVEENLLQHPAGFTPICVPFHDKERIGNVTGFYYDLTIENSDETLVNQFDVPFRYNGLILGKRRCYEHLHITNTPERKELSFDKTLCFKFLNMEDHMRVEGGPVIYSPSSIVGRMSTAFLFGVATSISTPAAASGYEASTGLGNVYLSSIKPLVKFIEYHADLRQGKDKSIWCKTPQLTQEKISPSDIPFPDMKQRGVEWPWLTLKEPIQRDQDLDCVCGLARSQSGRVIGGSQVPRREYGWMTLVYILIPNTQTRSICGGSIINDRVILTAAHCVVDDDKINQSLRRVSANPDNIEVKINVHHRHSGDGKSFNVAAVLFHPDYVYPRSLDSRYYDYDVALLVLKDKLTFPRGHGVGSRPICLTDSGGKYVNVVGRNAWVAGWGRLSPEGETSKVLQHLEVPIQPLDVCRKITFPRITSNFLCAGTMNKFYDTSRGDSGGPLMLQDPMNVTAQWFQVGIISWGFDSDAHGYTNKSSALYSDVQKLLPFIDYHSQRVGAKWCKL